MRIEITIPADKVYVERLFDCIDYIDSKPVTNHKDSRLRRWVIEEFRRIRAKYNGNPKVDMEAIIEMEDSTPMEKPLYQFNKSKLSRFDKSLETEIDNVARIIRNRRDNA